VFGGEEMHEFDKILMGDVVVPALQLTEENVKIVQHTFQKQQQREVSNSSREICNSQFAPTPTSRHFALDDVSIL
jgi:hypothetical protein